MMIDVSIDPGDDDRFVDAVRAVINGAAQATEVDDVIVVKVDNWFGPKWLGFSHKALGAFGVRSRTDLRVPPFRPSRIMSERRFVRAGATSSFTDARLARPVHIVQDGEANARRRVAPLFPAATLFWWTGRSGTNGRGALMCYHPSDGGHACWYAAHQRDGGWSESASVSITGAELARFGTAAFDAD